MGEDGGQGGGEGAMRWGGGAVGGGQEWGGVGGLVDGDGGYWCERWACFFRLQNLQHRRQPFLLSCQTCTREGPKFQRPAIPMT